MVQCRSVKHIWIVSFNFKRATIGQSSVWKFPLGWDQFGVMSEINARLKISKINWDHQGSIPVYTSLIIYDFCIYGGNMFITQPWATETLCNIFFLPWFFSSTSRVLPWLVPSILQNNLAEAARWVYGFNRYTYIDGPLNKRRSFVWTSNRQNFGQNQPPVAPKFLEPSTIYSQGSLGLFTRVLA